MLKKCIKLIKFAHFPDNEQLITLDAIKKPFCGNFNHDRGRLLVQLTHENNQVSCFKTYCCAIL